MNHTKQSSTARPFESGHAILELALILPVLVFVSVAGIELSRCLKHIEFSVLASREAASIAFRDCAGEAPDRVALCLEDVRQQVETQMRGFMGGTEIILSAYELQAGQLVRTGIAGERDQPSRFSAAGGAGDLPAPDLASSHRVLITAEVYLPFEPLIPMVDHLPPFNDGWLYESTII